MVPLTSAGNLNGRTEEEKQSKRYIKKKLKQNEEIEKVWRRHEKNEE